MVIGIGMIVLFGSLLLGYTMHGGNLMVLWQVSEFVIIGGTGLGAVIIAEKPAITRRLLTDSLKLFRPSPYHEGAYRDLLRVLYEIFYLARKDGLVGVEEHIETPGESAILSKYPEFLGRPRAVAFLADNMKVLLSGTIEDHHLAEVLEIDLDQQHEEAMEVPRAMRNLADAMPAFGIVACVLGVIITMGKINESAEAVGQGVAAALVGTLLGVFLAYGIFAPLARALTRRAHAGERYVACIRTALLSFARGDSPVSSVEFARRNIDPEDRPSFGELEETTREARRGGGDEPGEG